MSPGTDRKGSPYHFRQNGKYAVGYQEAASLQQREPINIKQQLGALPSPLKHEDLKPIMIDVNELMDYQKKRNMSITLRRSQEDRKGAKTAQGGMRESFEKN